MHPLLIVLIVLLSIWLMAAILNAFIQEWFIFRPVLMKEDEVYNFPFTANEIWLDTPGEGKINCLHFPVESAKPKGLILYFHGNRDNLKRWGNYSVDFTSMGYEMLMPDYRGYGKSRGPRSEAAFHADALALYQYAREHFAELPILLYGRSLGSGMASRLAANTQPQMLLLETPFYNLPKLYRSLIGPVARLLPYKYRFRSDLSLQQVKCPVYIFHGTRDRLVPYEQGVKLSKLPPQCELITIPDASHSNVQDFVLYQHELKRILN